MKLVLNLSAKFQVLLGPTKGYIGKMDEYQIGTGGTSCNKSSNRTCGAPDEEERGDIGLTSPDRRGYPQWFMLHGTYGFAIPFYN